jgi:hypothetical protein
MVVLAAALAIIITTSHCGAPLSASSPTGAVSRGALVGGADTPHTGGVLRMYSARGMRRSK